MVKFQPSFIIDKYKNSTDHWILPIPVFDNGELKIRCFMSRKKIGHFTDIYTYNIDKSRHLLVLFYKEKSYGQAYHKFLRLIKHRDTFILENDHEKGFFTMEDVKNTMFIGQTAYICSMIQRKIDNSDDSFNFDWSDKIKESERKTVAQLRREAIEQEEKELLDMGYDY